MPLVGGVKIPWVVGRYTMGMGLHIPLVGGQNTMVKWVFIPWIGVKIPWVGVSIYHGQGAPYTIGRGSKYHG